MQGYAYAGIAAAIIVGGPVTTAVAPAVNVAVHSVATPKPDDTAVQAGQTVSSQPRPVLDVAVPRPAVTRTIYLPRSDRPEPPPLAQPPLPVLRPTPVQDRQWPAPAAKTAQARMPPPVKPSGQPARRPARVGHHRRPSSSPRPFRAAPQIQLPVAPQAVPPPPASAQQYAQPVSGLLPFQAVPQAPIQQEIPPLPLPSVAPARTPTPRPSQAPAISMLTTREIGKGDHASWVPVLGIAIAAEVALLWVAACLRTWQRRMAFSGSYVLPHPARALTKMCKELRKARRLFRRRS